MKCTVKRTTLLCSVIAICWACSHTSFGQEQSISEEVKNAISTTEKAGGRVMRIAANTDQHEASFHLSSVPVKDESLSQLKSIPNLVWLNLANSEITDAGLKHIADLPLTKLHLEKTKIGNAGMTHLRNLKKLEYLNLYSTQVGDEGLVHLTGLENLKKLYVWQSSVTEAGIKKLQAALPELEIVGELNFEPPKKEAAEEEENKAEGDKGADEKGETKNDDDKKDGLR